MLGSFENSLNNARFDHLQLRPPSRPVVKRPRKQEQPLLSELIEREWSELPYAMMRLTAARRPWDNNRVYWRDRSVQLGNIDLTLANTRTENDRSRYTATYMLDDLCRDFAFEPSLEGDVLRWSAPGICDTAKLTTDQLAEKLLAKLVTFYSTGLEQPAATSSASPGLSS